ncbi:acylphosphatase [Sphingomonas lutea]|uniref:acylphosphatase n=1 Tax=Sphingomonas lutea TaxID=1045317 RepID=A0A7G9SHN4_9SPHN|nr:acylphosphatase [Sphingomonas lutea]QNN67359.1 acylphosphatase [Sphingomonas lutea]
MTITRHVRVTGQVQGVFYRVWAQGQARELGVSGWIRNCADGTVEAHVAGEEHDVARMIERMRRGPANARVDDVEVAEVDPGELSHRFEVRH